MRHNHSGKLISGYKHAVIASGTTENITNSPMAPQNFLYWIELWIDEDPMRGVQYVLQG